MARNHARILTSIWNDDDFLALSADAQRVYLLLLSQQNLSHAGLLPLTVKRWANKAPNTTVEDFERALAELETARFVVIDGDTEELLVRSLMRGDEAWKHWKVMTAAARDAAAVASPLLRGVLAAEVGRMLAILELPAQSRTLLEGLRDGFPLPIVWEPDADASPQGQGLVTLGDQGCPPLPPWPAPTPAPVARADDDPTMALLIEHTNGYAEPLPPSAQAKIKPEIMRLVAEGVEPERIRRGLTRIRERGLAASLLPQLVTESAPRRSTGDERVAAALALAARYDAEEAGA
jgi:hypothetical protein